MELKNVFIYKFALHENILALEMLKSWEGDVNISVFKRFQEALLTKTSSKLSYEHNGCFRFMNSMTAVST